MKLRSLHYFIWILAFAGLFQACEPNTQSPKPRMYPRIFYPDNKYLDFSTAYCPFRFQQPDYWKFVKDTSFFGEKPQHECWFNLEIPIFQGSLHCSYYEIHNKSELNKYLRDAYKMAREHQIKANYIDEIPIHKPNKVSGMLYNIEGASASPFQFYLTDSITHFFRASLYFNTQVRPDSIQPISEFVKRDIMTMLNSFEWK